MAGVGTHAVPLYSLLVRVECLPPALTAPKQYLQFQNSTSPFSICARDVFAERTVTYDSFYNWEKYKMNADHGVPTLGQVFSALHTY